MKMKIYFIPILTIKDKEFVYPSDYLSERAETGIKSLLTGFEILNFTWKDGILIIKAELDRYGKIVISEGEDNIQIQVHRHLKSCFKNTKYGFTYLYRKECYRLTLVYLSVEV